MSGPIRQHRATLLPSQSDRLLAQGLVGLSQDLNILRNQHNLNTTAASIVAATIELLKFDFPYGAEDNQIQQPPLHSYLFTKDHDVKDAVRERIQDCLQLALATQNAALNLILAEVDALRKEQEGAALAEQIAGAAEEPTIEDAVEDAEADGEPVN